jgi:hypothetical protein
MVMHDELEKTQEKAAMVDIRVERLSKTKNDTITGTVAEIPYVLVNAQANQLGRKHVGCRIRNSEHVNAPFEVLKK